MWANRLVIIRAPSHQTTPGGDYLPCLPILSDWPYNPSVLCPYRFRWKLFSRYLISAVVPIDLEIIAFWSDSVW